MATPKDTSGSDPSARSTSGESTSGGPHRVSSDSSSTARPDPARGTSGTVPTQQTERGEHLDEVQPAAPVAQPTHEHRDDSEARDRFGGINWGAGFFGWLVAIGMTILLSGLVGAVLAAIGSQVDITLRDARSSAGSIGIGAGITLLVVLMLAYFTGGYVAGRMSRFDGAKQGIATWVIGLVVTLIVAAVGAAAGDTYNIFDRISLPRVPLNVQELGTGGLITAAAVLLGTLLAAVLGGVVGHSYHNKVDRAAGITR